MLTTVVLVWPAFLTLPLDNLVAFGAISRLPRRLHGLCNDGPFGWPHTLLFFLANHVPPPRYMICLLDLHDVIARGIVACYCWQPTSIRPSNQHKIRTKCKSRSSDEVTTNAHRKVQCDMWMPHAQQVCGIRYR